MILAIYLPLVLGAVGVAVSLRAYMRSRSGAFLPAAAAFCIPVIVAVAEWIRIKTFVPVEIEPGVWSAAVVHADLPETVILALVIVTVALFGRGETQTQDSEQSVGGDAGKAADGLTGAPQR